MNFKLILAALLVSGAAFGKGALTTRSGKEMAPGSSKGSVIEATTQQNQEARKNLEVQGQKATDVQQRASDVEAQAQQELATPEAKAAGEKIAAKAAEKLKNCVSGICEALKDQVSELARQGHYKASTVLRNALMSIKKGGDQTELIKASLVEADLDPKKVEDGCRGKGLPVGI